MRRHFPIDITPLFPSPKVVSIPDPNLAAAVQEEIGDRITTHTMLNLTRLDVPNRQITDLTGLEYAHGLVELNLGREYIVGEGYVNSNTVSDFSPLEGLEQLVWLDLSNTTIMDVSPLTGLIQLTTLYFSDTAVSDVSPLAELTQLGYLDISGTAVRDIFPLAGLTQLIRLDLSNLAIRDVSPLAGLTQLISLRLFNNDISDASALSGLTQLTVLNLHNNSISDISALSALTQLTSLNLHNNDISDISALSGLTQLTVLNLSHNDISDISVLSGLTQMIGLDLFNNGISDVSALSDLTQLTSLTLSNNAISDISVLSGLTQMIGLHLSNNGISDVSALSDLTELTVLNLSNNNISDISALSDLTQLTGLNLYNNAILDVSPLTGLTKLKGLAYRQGLDLRRNPLSYTSIDAYIPNMQVKGVEVEFNNRTPTTLVKISGTAQQGTVNTALALPLVVKVRDQQNQPFAGVPVTFTIGTGAGKLNATTTTTGATGRAEAYLTLGRTVGTTTVRVAAADISQPVKFTATAILLSSPVSVTDTNLRVKILETLGKSHSGILTAADMLKLTTLAANNANISNLTGLQHAPNLKTLSLNGNNLSNVTPLAGLPELTALSLNNNRLSDMVPLAALTQLKVLSLENNSILDVSPLAALTQLEVLSLSSNNLIDVASLTPLTQLKTLQLKGNLLSYPSLHTHIPAIQAGGATVTVDTRTPTTLVKISGTHGVAGTAIPIIVEVQDEQGLGFSGVPVTFTVITGGGRLSPSNLITDTTGRARTTLTLGTTLGKNTVRSAVVEISQPAVFSIIAINANTPVTIRDTNLRAKILEALSKDRGVQLTAGDMLKLTRLEAPNANIRNLTGIEHAHNLTYMNLGGEYISGEGYVNSNTVSDFSPLFSLTQLTQLNLFFSSLTDVSFLSDMPQLTWLRLSNNNISDISALAGLTQLTYLNLSNTLISDASPLAGLTQLRQLHFHNTIISDMSPLAGLTQLTSLGISSLSLSDVSVLSGLTQLASLSISGTAVWDISPLAGLTQLTYLNLGSNPISDISALSHLTQLTQLHLYNNDISDVSVLSGLTQLTVLNLRNNAILDVSPLVGLNLTGTQWNSTGLVIERNPLNYASVHTHIPAMQAKGVEVQFDNQAHSALVKISGGAQKDAAGARLATPFVVEALDPHGAAMTRVSVRFHVIEGGGHLSATTVRTDANGRAETTLTLGRNPGVNKVRVRAAGITYPVTFTATAGAEPVKLAADINGDGVVNVQDLVLVSSNFGRTGQNSADVNGDGVVNITDLVLVAGAFGGSAAAPALHPSLLAKLSATEIQRWLDEAKRLDQTDAAYLTWHCDVGTPPDCLDSQRDNAVGKLSKPV